MLAIIACVLGCVGFVLSGVQAHTGPWDSPQALVLAALACIALHLAGFPGIRSK